MNAGNLNSRGRGRAGSYYPTARFFRLSDLRTLRRCEKVAAICFRVRGGMIEFLLVQTRGGRWTFPKGNAEPGLTTAQAAALEAFEEAGVHGRMEEISFTSYVRPRNGGKAGDIELLVTAHLCEVLSLEPPQESGRNPSWFSPAQAKRRLRDSRSEGYGTELARVVDEAARRVKLVRSRPTVAQISAAMDLDDLRNRMRSFTALPAFKGERRSRSTRTAD